MRNLSKSRLLSFRQCPKRLWLELHKPDVQKDTAATEASFRTGLEVGVAARKIYDPDNKGVLVDAQAEGFGEAIARSRRLLETRVTVFEAGVSAEGALAFADIMLPVGRKGRPGWRMVEVKSSTSVKDYHHDDAAIQAFVFRAAGIPLESIAIARIDSAWVYPGKDHYQGLLIEEDLTEKAMCRAGEVKEWLAEAHSVATKRDEPRIGTGTHCNKPFGCGFAAYCQGQEPRPRHATTVLPQLRGQARTYIDENAIIELREVPDSLLNPLQLRVKKHTLSGKLFFDTKGAATELARHKLPALFLDFETINRAVPIWKGTRPYQQVPFQFSLHRLGRTGKLEHEAFLDLSGGDPSKALAPRLVDVCGTAEPVFVYNMAFEKKRLQELAARFPPMKKALNGIIDRLVDLLPIARKHFYHPDQEGSWSIKAVLPTVAPDLDYAMLEHVKDGGLAQEAFVEATHPGTGASRKAELEKALHEYCKLDTYAMVRLWQVFAGRKDLRL